MAKNHEIRFGCKKELPEKAETIWRAVAFDLKKTAFYEKVFLLGLNNIQKQAIDQKPNILSNLTKTGELK